MAKELTNSELMNQLIRGGKLPKRQEEETTDPAPEEVIEAVAKLVEELPDDEIELFRDRVFAALYPEVNTAGAAS